MNPRPTFYVCTAKPDCEFRQFTPVGVTMCSKPRPTSCKHAVHLADLPKRKEARK